MLDQRDRAEEHWLTFLDNFTNPDPEYEWMVEEARGIGRIGAGTMSLCETSRRSKS